MYALLSFFSFFSIPRKCKILALSYISFFGWNPNSPWKVIPFTVLVLGIAFLIKQEYNRDKIWFTFIRQNHFVYLCWSGLCLWISVIVLSSSHDYTHTTNANQEISKRLLIFSHILNAITCTFGIILLAAIDGFSYTSSFLLLRFGLILNFIIIVS